MDEMDADQQKFMLLEDCTGSIVSKRNSMLVGALRKMTFRANSFQAFKGMLFQQKLDHRTVIDIVSCENNEYHIQCCPLKSLKLLTDDEFNLLLAIPSYYDRVEVCRPGPNGGKSKLQHGVEAREGDVVEVLDTTGKVKTGIGYIHGIGPNKEDINKKGTFFCIVLSGNLKVLKDTYPPKVAYLPLRQLGFKFRYAKKEKSPKEVVGSNLNIQSADDVELIALVKQQEEILRKIEEKRGAAYQAHNVSFIPDPTPTLAPALALIPPPPSTHIPKEVAVLCECSICFNFFHEPKSLQCEHHFCKDCLGELVKFNENELPYITCPTCNSVHLFGDENDILESLKCQLFVKQLLDSYCGSMNINEEPRCCNKPVHWYCGDCRRYLCDECYAYLDGKACQSKTSVRYSRSKESVLPHCEVHNMLQYWGCDTCSCTVCPYCVKEHHNDHKILSLLEYAGQWNEDLVNSMEFTKEENKKIERDLSDKSDEAKKAIKKKAIDIMNMVRYVEKEMIDKAELMQRREHYRLEKKLKENLGKIQKAQLVQDQGSVGVIWGSRKLVEAARLCDETYASFESHVELVDGDLYRFDGKQNLMSAVANCFRDLHFTCMDEFGNAEERKIDVAAALM